MPTSQKFSVNSQNGQIILILVLVMTAALVVGLAVIQRSLTDVSSSTKSEQSSRAFSAAEAGIERALRTNSSVTNQALGNDSSIQQVDVTRLPTGNRPVEPNLGKGISKEDFAQVWLANPQANDADGSPAAWYGRDFPADSLVIYWGDGGQTTDIPAIEVNILYRDSSGVYRSSPHFYDPVNTVNPCRRSCNHFDDPTLTTAQYTGSCNSPHVLTDLNPDRAFYCRVTISGLSSLIGAAGKLIMVRAHLLYNEAPRGFAVAPSVGSLPPQQHLFISTGTSGDITRTVSVLSTDKVCPIYCDYAIFSLGDIRK